MVERNKCLICKKEIPKDQLYCENCEKNLILAFINRIKIPNENWMFCSRCGHVWKAYHPNITVCPRCKSPYWNVQKKKKDDK